MTDRTRVRSPRRTTAIAAVAVVAVAATAAAIALLVPAGHRDVPVSRPARTGTLAGPTPAVPTDHTEAVPPDDTDPTDPTDPTDATDRADGELPGGELTWITVAGARVPVSRTAGPLNTDGGRAWGFTRTPLGAVLAAAHLSLRLCPQVGPAVFEATLREQVIGPDAAALGQHLADDYEQARTRLGLPYGAPVGRLYATAYGYRVALADPGAAAVRLLIEGPGKAGATVLVEVRVDLRWHADDWLLVAPPGGTWDTVTAVVADPTGYTRFPDGG